MLKNLSPKLGLTPTSRGLPRSPIAGGGIGNSPAQELPQIKGTVWLPWRRGEAMLTRPAEDRLGQDKRPVTLY